MEAEYFLARLENKDTAEAYKALLELEMLSEKSDCLYPYTERFSKMIKDEKSYIRVRGFRLLCKQAKWDIDGKLEVLLPEALSILKDAKPTAVRQALAALCEVATFKPALCDTIKNAVREIDLFTFKDSMSPLIAADIKRLLHETEKQAERDTEK